MTRERDYDYPRFLSDGTAIYPMRRRGDPPPDMEGYARRGNDPMTIDAWIFKPLWVECSNRQQSLVQRESGCKCVRILMTCRLAPEGDRLTLAACQNCQLNIVHEEQVPIELSNGEGIGESIVGIVECDPALVAEGLEPKVTEGDVEPTDDSLVVDAEGE
jgi:hypothetical protein